MTNILKELQKYYKLIDSGGILMIEDAKGEREILWCEDKTVILSLSNGESLEIYLPEIHQEFYNLSDDEVHLKMYGYDSKTKKYFDNIKSNMGFIKMENRDDPEELYDYELIKLWKNVKDVVIGTNKESLWVAQFSVGSYDDFGIVAYVFNQKPSEEDVRLIDKIHELQIRFRDDLTDTFTCKLCGDKVHWLDTEGNFYNKLDSLTKRYCDKEIKKLESRRKANG